MKDLKRTVARVLLSLLSIAAVGAIFYNSSLDAVSSSAQSGTLLAAVNNFLRTVGISITISETVLRKAAHFAEYAVLGALLMATAYAYVPRCGRAFWITLSAGACTAVGDELIQLGSAGRSCEVRDMAIDFSGVLFAAGILRLILYLIDRKRKV